MSLPLVRAGPLLAVAVAVALAMVLLLAAAPADAAVLTGAKHVVSLTSANHDKVTRKSKYSAVVLYYANWCGHCKSFGPHFISASNKLAGMAILAAVDCDVQKDVCSKEGIQGFPTIKGYFADKNMKVVEKPYNSARTEAGVISFVKSNTPNIVSQISDASGLQKFKESDASLYKVLIKKSKKRATHPTVKHMALAFHNKVKIGEYVDNKDGQQEEKNPQKSADVVFIVPETLEEIKYVPQENSSYSYKHLREFIVNTVKQHKARAGAGGPDKSKVKIDKKPDESKSKPKAAEGSKTKSSSKAAAAAAGKKKTTQKEDL